MIDNYINHIAMVLDGSGSMQGLAKEVVEVADQQVAYLAKRSQETNQETRVSLYVFEDRNKIICHAYDKDVLRLPSLAGLYRAKGQTPLIDATIKALDDLGQTATLYGDHSFLVYVLTDGQENASSAQPYDLSGRIDRLPAEWTLACFVPDQIGKREAKQFGFPGDNIAIWDTTKGLKEVGETIRRTTDAYFKMRSSGGRGTKNLFSIDTDALKKTVVTRALQKLGPGQFRLLKVDRDEPIASFVESKTQRPYKLGEGFYQLTVPVKVQAQKEIALYHKKEHAVYRGDSARQLLGLPDYEVKVEPANTPDFDIFIQSTSVNRKLLAGTKLLLF